jgi:hypothetical protein
MADLERNPNSIDAGQGLTGLPGSILGMTSHPETLIDPAKLPVDPKTCKPVYPHLYIKVNTIFEVARQHELRTAWSDKHPAYKILDSPSGTGVQDLFTPEINSQADGLPAGQDWTKDNAKTQAGDPRVPDVFGIVAHDPAPARPEPQRAASRSTRAHPTLLH